MGTTDISKDIKFAKRTVGQSRIRGHLSAESSTKKIHQRKGPPIRSSPRNMLLLFFFATLIPISFEIVGLRLTPIRLVLLVTILPFLVRIISGQAGRFSGVDKLIIFHGTWVIISLMANHGTSRIPFAVINAVELTGGYMFGRAVVRSVEDYRLMLKIFLFSLIFLFPFALTELFTGRLVIPELVSSFFSTHYRGASAYGRLGLERVYGVFEHPILYGLYCSVAIANIVYYLKNNPFKQIIGVGFTLGMTFMSLSSAPLLSGVVQLLLILWGRITKGAWKPLLILSVVGYVAIDLLSNRTPVAILVETLTYSSGNGWIRIIQFQYGIQEVINSPFFGIGMNDWHRPDWMRNLSSVDNFWLLTAMRYGFVGSGFLVFAVAAHISLSAKVNNLTEEARGHRLGYLIALVGVCLSLCTVHIWGSAAVFITFYLGAGAWIYTSDNDIEEKLEIEAPPPSKKDRTFHKKRIARKPSK